MHDFPGQINPYLDPLIKWLDCDHQAGGAWQITKLKFEEFESLLDALAFVDETGLELITRIKPFSVREKHHELSATGDLLPKESKQKALGKNAAENLISAAAKDKPSKGRKPRAKTALPPSA